MGELLDPQARSARGAALQAEVAAAPAPQPATPLGESWRDFVFAEIWAPPWSGAARALPHLDRRRSDGGRGRGHPWRLRSRRAEGRVSHPGGTARGGAAHGGLWRLEPGRGDRARGGSRRRPARPAASKLPADPRRGLDTDERTAQGMHEFAETMTFPGGPSISPFLEGDQQLRVRRDVVPARAGPALAPVHDAGGRGGILQ